MQKICLQCKEARKIAKSTQIKNMYLILNKLKLEKKKTRQNEL